MCLDSVFAAGKILVRIRNKILWYEASLSFFSFLLALVIIIIFHPLNLAIRAAVVKAPPQFAASCFPSWYFSPLATRSHYQRPLSLVSPRFFCLFLGLPGPATWSKLFCLLFSRFYWIFYLLAFRGFFEAGIFLGLMAGIMICEPVLLINKFF